MHTKSSLEIAREGNVAVASFKGPCISDVEDITSASARIREYIQASPPRRMVFDFHGIKFFSSQVLGLLLEARSFLRPHHGEVAVTSLNPQLQRVFKITSLDKIFRLYPDLPTALQSAVGRSN